MSSAHSRSAKLQKGHRLQKWIAQKISELTGYPYGVDEMIASREGCMNGCDIRLVGDARIKFPYSVECKNQETWSVPQWIAQAKSNEMEGTSWLLVISKNNYKPVVVLDAEVFFKILEGINDKKNRIK